MDKVYKRKINKRKVKMYDKKIKYEKNMIKLNAY